MNIRNMNDVIRFLEIVNINAEDRLTMQDVISQVHVFNKSVCSITKLCENHEKSKEEMQYQQRIYEEQIDDCNDIIEKQKKEILALKKDFNKKELEVKKIEALDKKNIEEAATLKEWSKKLSEKEKGINQVILKKDKEIENKYKDKYKKIKENIETQMDINRTVSIENKTTADILNNLLKNTQIVIRNIETKGLK